MQPKTIAKPSINSVEAWIWLLESALPKTFEQVNSKQKLLQRFCIDTNKYREWFLDSKNNNLYYTPQQSLFMAVLCQPFNEDISVLETLFFNYDILKKADNNNNSRAFLPWVPKNCDPTSDMKDCDFSKLLPALFSAVMNDHSTLSMAWWTWTDENENTIIKNFSNTYFGTIWQEQCKSADRYFLDNQSSSTKEEAICSHPKTHALLKNTIQDLQKQKKNIQTLEIDELLSIQEETPTKDTKWCTIWWDLFYANMFLCGYSTNNTDDRQKRATQYNLQFNELLYYKILIARLSDVLSKNNIAPLDLTKTQLTADQATSSSPEVQSLARELAISQQAVTTMQKTLDGFHATFPLHIWLSAYYEDVLNVRKSLAKVYTPINQLYYKLRNIQQKQ